MTTMMSIEQFNVRGHGPVEKTGITVGLVGVHVYGYRWDHDSGTRNPVQLLTTAKMSPQASPARCRAARNIWEHRLQSGK